MILVEIAGFLGADAEERFTAGGKKVISLRMATRVRFQGKEDTVWWRVSIWDDRFDKMVPYFKKGTALIVVGEMSKPEIYVDKEGKTQISLNLQAVMIKFSPFGKSTKSEGAVAGPYEAKAEKAHEPAGYGDEMAAYGVSQGGAETSFPGDDLPF